MKMLLAALSSVLASAADPIIGGQGKFQYQFMPDQLAMPAGSDVQDCHGLAVDKDENIYLTYVPKNKDTNCLVRWAPDGSKGAFMSAGGTDLSSGTPHGLKIAFEEEGDFLYHANNNDKLTKSKLDGTVVWQVSGNFGQDPAAPYRPTWFAVPPKSKYVYLADGYGSSNVYVFTKEDGKFTNNTFGGKGTEHGKFQTCHGITYDPRVDKLLVSDRENHRLEYFDFDHNSPDKFEYSSTVTMPNIQRPCNVRMYPDQEGRAVVAALEGPVAILDANNEVLSMVNVSGLIGDQGSVHPHDAVLLPNGDLVVATWNPGHISYWKWLK